MKLILLALIMLSSCSGGKLEKLAGTAGPLEIKIENFTTSNLYLISEATEVRPIALSPNNEILYTCSLMGLKTLYAHNISNGIQLHSSVYGASPRFCKSMDTHSSGRVYFSLSDSDEIGLANADLTGLSYVQIESLIAGIGDTGTNDVDPQQLYVYLDHLYVASDKLGKVYRFNLNSSNGDILNLDTTWGTSGEVQVKNGANVNIGSSDELLSMVYDPDSLSLYVVVEGIDSIVKISNNGTSQTFGVLNIPADSSPHDIIILNDYFFVSYGAFDGTQNKPIGIGVFKKSDFSHVDTLIDVNKELRNAQGLVAIESKNTFYVVDGFYGAPNDISLPRVSDAAAQNVIMKFEYSKD